MAERKNTIDDQVKKQQEAVFKAKDRYDREVEKLDKLISKQKEDNRRLMLKAFDQSGKTVGEVLNFLGYDENAPVKKTGRRGRHRIKNDQDDQDE